jgi:uncharacterized membrane protein YdjX (TVP38/TMEM64 family)
MKRFWRVVARGLIFLAIMVAAGGLFQEFGLWGSLDESWIDTHVRGSGASGVLLYILSASIFAAVGLPRQIASFLGGYAFGFMLGLVYALIASVIGAAATLLVARYLARDLVSHRLPARMRKIDEFLSRETFVSTLVIRLMPFGSNLATNLVAGISRAGVVAFLAGSFVGFIPQTAVFALAGSGVSVDPTLRIGVAAVLFLASSALGVWVIRRYRRKDGSVEGPNLIDATEFGRPE